MTIAAIVATRPLKRGDKGTNVAALQSALRSAGHELVIDGNFGTITEVAVKKFQASAKLDIDGQVGPITAARLDQLMALSATPSGPLPSVISVAPWLAVNRALTGTKEIPGARSNPLILDWVKEIVAAFPDLRKNVGWYTNDDTPWCGLEQAYCVVKGGGYKPPLAPLYATNWFHQWPDGVELKEPCPGAIMVMTRDGGGHVTQYEGEDETYWFGRGGNQSNMVNVARFPKSRKVLGIMWPKRAPLPTTGRRRISLAAAESASEA